MGNYSLLAVVSFLVTITTLHVLYNFFFDTKKKIHLFVGRFLRLVTVLSFISAIIFGFLDIYQQLSDMYWFFRLLITIVIEVLVAGICFLLFEMTIDFTEFCKIDVFGLNLSRSKNRLINIGILLLWFGMIIFLGYCLPCSSLLIILLFATIAAIVAIMLLFLAGLLTKGIIILVTKLFRSFIRLLKWIWND